MSHLVETFFYKCLNAHTQAEAQAQKRTHLHRRFLLDFAAYSFLLIRIQHYVICSNKNPHPYSIHTYTHTHTLTHMFNSIYTSFYDSIGINVILLIFLCGIPTLIHHKTHARCTLRHTSTLCAVFAIIFFCFCLIL